jgi:hypothetical protein
MGLFSFLDKVGTVASITSSTIKLQNILTDASYLSEREFAARLLNLPLPPKPKDYLTWYDSPEYRRWDKQVTGLVASNIIDKILNEFPEVYSGKFGQRPHEMTTMFIALLHLFLICNKFGEIYFLCEVQKIGEDIIKNRNFYPFTSMDIELISKHMPSYEPHRPYEYYVSDMEEVYDESGSLCNIRDIYSAIPMEHNWKY